MKYVDSLIHHSCVWNSIYLSKFQVNTVTNIEVMRQNVLSHARVMVVGVSSDLNDVNNEPETVYDHLTESTNIQTL